MRNNDLTREETYIIDSVITACISVMGEEKWRSLTAKQQHDAIMIIVGDANKALDIIAAKV